MSELEHLKRRFNAVAENAQTFTFGPRAIELQEEALANTRQFLCELTDRKPDAIFAANEYLANTILGMQLGLEALCCELSMWISLKRDDGEAAWTHLVSAQSASHAAISVREHLDGAASAEGLVNNLAKLMLIEQAVFPPQVFSSFGGRVRRRTCSICNELYDLCAHVKGRPYMGELCATVLSEIDLEEVSIVPVPASKHARITHFGDGGRMRNRMTWRLEEHRVDDASGAQASAGQ